MRLLSKLLCLTSIILNISLIIASLGVTKWSIVDSDKDLGLYSCEDCGAFKNRWNYECLGRSYCSEDGKDAECSLYKDLYKASYSFMVLEFAALVLSFLFLEKCVLAIFGKFSGNRLAVFLYGALMLCLHVLGTILWFVYSEAGQTCDSTSYKSRPDLCFSLGPSLAIANCILMPISLILTIFLVKTPQSQTIEEYTPGRVLWISGQIFSLVSLILMSGAVVLMLSSLTIDKWLIADDYRGGLIRCKDCDSNEWLGWSCLESQECEINEESSKCSDYKKVSKAANVFVGLQAATFICVTFFLQYLTAYIRGQSFGFPALNYVFALASITLNVASIVDWFAISEVTIQCEDGKLCADNGAQLAIASNFLMLPAVAVYLLSFYRRRQVIVSLDVTTQKHYNSIVENKSNCTPDDTVFVKNPS